MCVAEQMAVPEVEEPPFPAGHKTAIDLGQSYLDKTRATNSFDRSEAC
jgi:hypothetical protein